MKDVIAELRVVLGGRPVLDGAIPVLVFGLLAGRSIPWAVGGALVAAGLLAIRRARLGGPLGWAGGGVVGVALAGGFAWWSGQAGGFFVPGVVRGIALAVVALVSLALPLPMVAWTSKLFRRWPAGWYRHRAVRPAYVETTAAWAVLFGARAWAQWAVLDAPAGTQAALALVMGWPATIAALVATYLYGRRRLVWLGGPSVAEWADDVPPPWSGQRSGF